MKTKEDILKTAIGEGAFKFEGSVRKSQILWAMQEYADQFKCTCVGTINNQVCVKCATGDKCPCEGVAIDFSSCEKCGGHLHNLEGYKFCRRCDNE